MNRDELHTTAKALVAPGKGILAADESTGTCTKRFVAKGVESTEETRRQYRELLLLAPGSEAYVSGVILYDETIRQKDSSGKPFPEALAARGVIPGIKVDTGAKDHAGFPGEKVTQGLDDLRERVAEYYAMGARFAKWRAVITISADTPTTGNLVANAHALARYAALCQEGGLVPIVEPEVLINGDHSIERCYAVTALALRHLFAALHEQNCYMGGLLLKPSMVISGKDGQNRAGREEVARQTVRCLTDNVPASVPGIVFLSGGQGPVEATEHLNLMNTMGPHPWALSFSYGRALQQPALDTWSEKPGDAATVELAQKRFCARAQLNSAATKGEYTEAMEKELVGV